MSVAPIPAGYHSVTPYLIVRDASRAMEFYARAFGAREVLRLQAPGGPVGHAEVVIGDSHVMLADEMPAMDIHAPAAGQRPAVSLLLYVENADALFAQAVAAGAQVLRPLQDQFYGDRSGTLVDPFGHTWTIATHIAEIPQEEIVRRFEAMMSQA